MNTPPTPAYDAVLASSDGVWVRLALVDVAGGNLKAGVMLSQIFYWFGTRPDGRTRVTIKFDHQLWLAKADGAWHEEIRLNAREARGARLLLVSLGLIETRVRKFAGVPTCHIRPIPSAIDAALASLSYPTNGFDRRGRSEDLPLKSQGSDSGGVSSTESTDIEHKQTDSHGLDLFDRFWSAYPNPNERSKALLAWAALVDQETPEVLSAVISGASRYAAAVEGKDVRYMYLGHNFLRQRKWTDYPAHRARRDPGLVHQEI